MRTAATTRGGRPATPLDPGRDVHANIRPGDAGAGSRYPRGMSERPKRRTEVTSGLLGIGFDGADGHRRVTTGDNFLLLGGSEETHERMQDVVIRINQKLKRKGKTLRELSESEFEDIAKDSL